jgi:hypothetical protein
VSHISRGTARTGFIVTAYRPNDEGVLVPDMPSQCPCFQERTLACELTQHHLRARTTGPCFPLTVVYCRTHRKAFTLYPPGHVPYGRRLIAPVAENGDWVRPEKPLGRKSERPEFFRGTRFDAALDAQKKIPWRREPPNRAGLWWPTQGRHLERALSWLGVSPSQEDDLRSAIAETLDVATLTLLQQAEKIQDRPGYQSRGRGICAVLSALPQRPCLLDRLAHAGHLAGLWPTPLRWDCRANVLRRAYTNPLGTIESDPPG